MFVCSSMPDHSPVCSEILIIIKRDICVCYTRGGETRRPIILSSKIVLFYKQQKWCSFATSDRESSVKMGTFPFCLFNETSSAYQMWWSKIGRITPRRAVVLGFVKRIKSERKVIALFTIDRRSADGEIQSFCQLSGTIRSSCRRDKISKQFKMKDLIHARKNCTRSHKISPFPFFDNFSERFDVYLSYYARRKKRHWNIHSNYF